MDTTQQTLTVADIAAMADGRVKTTKTAHAFALVAKREGRYEIECGWAVPEADEDDYLSFHYHPFAGDKMQPWVGRRVVTTDPAEALTAYLAAKAAVFGSGPKPEGEIIGSVNRQ